MKRAKDKVALVTGGSRGIGKSACFLLAKEGAKVAVTDILDKEGEYLVNEINAMGGVAEYWHLDLSDEENVKDVMTKVQDKFGKVDILINNASMSGINKYTREITF